MNENNCTNFEVQLMTAADIAEVLQIENICGLGGQSQTFYEQELVNPFALLLIAKRLKKVLGYISSRLITPTIEILNIAVLPGERRLGIGDALLNKALHFSLAKGFTESWLEVRESNSAALEFYLFHDYKIVGKRPNYYSNPLENALLMTLLFSDNNPKK